MRKNIKAILLASCLALAVTGCSSNNEASKSTTQATTEASSQSETKKATMGEFNASDYASISGYKKLKVSKSDVEVKDSDVQSQVNSLINSKTTTKEIKDRAVKKGDTVNIDYTGKMNGKEFDGGSATGSDLVIGSGSFIDDFEDQLIGKKTGETVEVNVTFPDPYQNNPDYAGKDATFTVKINSIKESVVPEYTDKFVAANTDYKTIKEYEKSIRDNLYDSNFQSAVTDAMIKACKVKDYPKSLLTYCQTTAVNYYTQIASMYGLTYKEYLDKLGYTEESFLKALDSNIKTMATEELAFQLIEKAENITADKDGFDKWLNDYCTNNNTTVENIKKNYSDEDLEGYYKKDKVMDLLVKNATVEETKETESSSAAATTKASK